MSRNRNPGALDALFDEWTAARTGDGTLCRDGIIDQESFGKSGPRVLFILKETSTDDFERLGGDLRAWVRHPDAVYGTTWTNLALYAQAFVELEREDVRDDARRTTRSRATNALRQVAVLNLSKFTRRKSADMAAINAHAARDADFIKREIDIIDPEVIVACGVREPIIWLLSLGDAYLRQRGAADDGDGAVVALRGGGPLALLTRHPNRAPGVKIQSALSAAWKDHRAK